ncbi:hypothetical protein HNY73_017793 [Argiope bruennichi]|uniref:Uncharacterized protein n=1 Tax=Argiope bruennichi TaxID=94029 RepID=A0A8T0EB50_ARGBR|nr:hypothetical protein HNY73_017793 [Argiope bruennichi]
MEWEEVPSFSPRSRCRSRHEWTGVCYSDDEAWTGASGTCVEDMEWEEGPLPLRLVHPCLLSQGELTLKAKVPAPFEISAPKQKERLTSKTQVPSPAKARLPRQ